MISFIDYWIKAFDNVLNILMRFGFVRFLINERFNLLVILYFVVKYGQEYWEQGTPERADFYFIGMAVWSFLVFVALLYRLVRVASPFSVITVLAMCTYLAFEVYNEIFFQSESEMWQEAVVTSCTLLVISVVYYVFKGIRK